MNKPVTLWYRRLNKDQSLEFNHLEDGHNFSNIPKAMSKEQASQWKNGEWDFAHGTMDENHVVTVP